jgi:hypothetical protein
VFFGYSLHKGYKCLDIFTGRIYILRDVTFDERVFPFAHLHPNADAQLRNEILLLAPHPVPFGHGDSSVNTQAEVASYSDNSDELWSAKT